MNDMDINSRVRQLCQIRGWTVYRLAKESDITYSTLCTMLNKSNLPSIPTLLKICNGFGITLAQFFDDGNECVMLSDKEKDILNKWGDLTPENKDAAEKYIDYLRNAQTCKY